MMEERNLLLLSMSTLNKNDLFDKKTHGENIYIEGNDEFYGVSQLEPGTQYFLQTLQQKNRKIDRIYVIASNATRKPLNNDIIQHIQKYNLLPKTNPGMSVVDFFEERIRQYILHKLNNCDQSKALSYTKNEIDDIFRIVPLNDETDDASMNPLYESIRTLCNDIRNEKSTTRKVNLFTNMQGGRRNEVFIINAAVKMMEKQGTIEVEASDAIAYDRTEENHRIEDTTINDRIFEMVSGINEFMKTGRGDTLKDFMNDTENLQTTGLNKEKPIIETIVDISDAISLCDVQGFDEELSKLNNVLQEYKRNVPNDQKNKLFQSILQNLEDDYGVLLSNIENNTIDQIKWCISKKLYQQALTVVEAKIPGDIVRNSIIYFHDRTQMEEVVNENRSVPSYVTDSSFALIKYCIDKDALEHNVLVLETKDMKYISCQELHGDNITKIVNLLNKYFEIANIRNIINHAVDSEDRPDINEVKGILENFCKLYSNFPKNEISVDFSDIVVIDYQAIKEKSTFTELPIDNSEELRQKLVEIWGADENVIRDFTDINHAILQMDGLSWEEFQKAETTTYCILNQILEFLIRTDLNTKKVDDEHEVEEHKMRRFRKKGGRLPYERLIGSVQKIKGFYPDYFSRYEESKL